MPAFRLHPSLSDISSSRWDALHDGDNPFLQHAFLAGLEQHGCLRPTWGWRPLHAALWEGEELLAAAPAYLKTNSHGEFVFDHAWAHAYARYGIDYFPKWLVGIPYSPVSGPRLLARSPELAVQLAEAMRGQLGELGLSSLHLNFLPEEQTSLLDEGWLARCDVQYHWHRDPDWRDFDDFLAALTHRKRKNLRAERRQVQSAGIDFVLLGGDEASDDDLADMHAFYCDTFAQRGNHPALSLAFFRHLARAMPRSLVLAMARRDGRNIAGALFLRGRNRLFGRYWGAIEAQPGLHFEACFYQGIDYCLRQGIDHFEPGAQGEHKIARGFLPVFTHSRHAVREPGFAAALEPWCAAEREAVRRHFALAMDHSPYRHASDPAAG
jgi:uncharacterized protein